MAAEVRIDRHAVIGEILIEARPEQVFRALTDPRQVISWWGSPDIYRVDEFFLEPIVGGNWELHAVGWANETFQVSGSVLEYDPPRLLVFTWNPSWQPLETTVVRFDLTAEGEATRVRLRHEGFSHDRPGLEQHRYGWPLVLGWLQRFAQP